MPPHIVNTFIVTTLFACLLLLGMFDNSLRLRFTRSAAKRVVLGIVLLLVVWLGSTALLAVYKYFLDGQSGHMALVVLVPALCIIGIFAHPTSRQHLRHLSLSRLTYIHVTRLPIEIVLYWLYLNDYMPQHMTYEGSNWDIIAGISAPIIAYLCFTKAILPQKIATLWHFLALGLLLNVIANAAQLPAAYAGVAAPNLAVLYAPFIWLPSFLVPLMLFCHLVALFQLLSRSKIS
jgi:hypothetical protein